MKLIVGFDAKRIVRNGTGLGSYGRTLVNDLIRKGEDIDIHLYAPDEGRDDLRTQIIEGAHFHYPQTKRSIIHYPLSIIHSYWRSHGIVNDLKFQKIQVFHGLSGELPIGLRKAGIRSVVTIHDLIFMRHPEYYHWIDTKIYEWKFRKTIQEADRIIAISERTKQDIMELGHISDERIRVIYQSCSPRFSEAVDAARVATVRQRYLLPDRFILNVGTIERRKNLRLAADALPLLPQDLHLVAVGRQTAYAKELPESDRLHLLSGVPDDDLAVIYHLAEAFVYPSRYEGFGIPIIEAIAAGLPVVACTGSCLEEAGGPACLYVGPDDVEGMADAILAVLKDAAGRAERIRLSQEYIQRFRGLDVAGQVLELYKELV
jgi:Glycosyltransferase